MNAITAMFIAALSFSIYPLLSTIALDSVSPYLLTLLSQGMTTIVALVLLRLRVKSTQKTLSLIIAYIKLPLDIVIIPVMSGLALFLGGLFFVFALSMMSKTGATLIMESWPILAIIIARAIITHKEWHAFTIKDALLIFTTFIGFVLITFSETHITLNDLKSGFPLDIDTTNTDNLIGILLAVLSALFFAWGGVSRSYFVERLPHQMRLDFFSKKNSVGEANFTHFISCFMSVPFALISFILFENDIVQFSSSAILPIIVIGFSLAFTSTFYAYALTIADNANINLLWYIAPVFATLWLVIFGYSTVTPLLFVGGLLIIFSNFLLILQSKNSNG